MTVIYTPVLNKVGCGVVSPLDMLPVVGNEAHTEMPSNVRMILFCLGKSLCNF